MGVLGIVLRLCLADNWQKEAREEEAGCAGV